MVGCLTVGAGILARSEGVSKGTGADRRFVKNALKNAELQLNIIKISAQILPVPSKSQRLPIKSHFSISDNSRNKEIKN